MTLNSRLSPQSSLSSAIERSPLILAPDLPLVEAIAQMAAQPPASRYVFVVENSQVVGVFTADDLVPIVAQGINLAELRLAEVMQPSANPTSAESANFSTLSIKVPANQPFYLPVCDEQQQLVGAITADSLIRTLPDSCPCQLVEHWHLALMTVNCIIYDWDILQGLVDRTQGLEILGYSPQEALPTLEWWTSRIHPDDRERVKQAVKSALVAGDTLTIEYRIQHKDGHYLCVCDRGLILRNPQGQAVRVVGNTTDLTETKCNQDAIFQQQQFLRHVIDTNPNLIFAKDWDGQFTLANQALADAYGTTVEDLIGKTDADFNPNLAEVEQFLQDDRQVMTSLQPKFILEEPCTYANGEVHWLQTLKKPLVSADGQARQVLVVATDITERKQQDMRSRQLAEIALEQSQTRFQRLAANVPGMIYQYLVRADGSDTFVYVSSGSRDIYELEPETLMQDSYWIWATVHPDDVEAVRTSVEVSAATLQSWSCQWRILTPSGKQRWVQGNSRPERLANGDLIWDGVVIDISDRKQAEAELKANQARFQNLVETTSDWVWEVNANYCFTYVSPKVREILGYEPEEVLGKTFFDLMSPEAAFEMGNALGSTTSHALPFSCFEVRSQHKCDRHRTVILETSGVPILDEVHHFQGYRGISRDITERRQAEECLRHSEERFRVMFEREAIGVGLTTLDGRILASNPKLQEMLGYDETELSRLTFPDFTHPDDLAADLERFQVLVAGEIDSYQMEKRYIRKDKRIVWGYLTISLIRRADNIPQLAIATIHDISQRKQMEAALRESEERFRQLAEHIDEVFWIVDRPPVGAEGDRDLYEIGYISPAYEKIWGRSETSLYEQPSSWKQSIYVEDRPHVLAALATQFEAGYDIEYRIVRPDRSLRWIRDRAFPVTDATGQVYRLVGLAEDITERKQAEKTLRRSEEKFRKIFEDSPIGIAIASPQTNHLLRSNQALCKMLGYSETELNHLTFADLTHVEDLETSNQYLQSLQCGEYSSYNLEKRYIRKDKEIVWVNETFAVLRNSNGEIIFGLATIEDITQRKRAEEESQFLQSMAKAVYESEDFHSALSMTIQKVCEATSWDFGEAWIPRADGSVLECSPAWYSNTDSLNEFRQVSESLTFAPGAGIPGRVWVSKQPEWRRDVSQEDSKVYLRAKIAKKVGLKAALGLPILTVDGVLAILVFYMFESRDEDARLIELISASTELGLLIQRKRAEEEVRKALVKEKELNELKSRFVSMTSHEFRTPLGTILSSAELLEKYRHKWVEDKQVTHLHRIQTAVKHMTEMLNNVLTLGTVEAGKLEFKPALLDLVSFCETLVTELQAEDDIKGRIVFKSQFPSGQSYLDANLLRHILINLLTNALKYSPKTSCVHFSLVYESERAIFQIQDAGIGIPLEDQKRLFESFHRAANVGNIQGTGLGLAIVKNCLDLQGGQIQVASQVGMGTTFTIWLPIRQT